MEYQLTPSRQIQYSAPAGAHDDTVISLALAYHAATSGARMLPSAYIEYMREYNAIGKEQA